MVWIAHPNLGFTSVVAAHNRPDHVTLRFRSRLHLRRWREEFADILGAVPVEERPQADYSAGRVTVTVEGFAEVLRRLAAMTDYGNVKAEAERAWGDDAYVDALHAAWGVFLKVQQDVKHQAGPARRLPTPRRPRP